jgi:hypothetical protein
MFVPALATVVRRVEPAALLLTVYGGGIAAVLFMSGGAFLHANYKEARELLMLENKKLGLRGYLAGMGDSWWKILTPREWITTELGWPGIDWSNQDSGVL